jgi:4-hydroxy-3-polyprenylbenzoate decarboxylase
MGYRNLRQCLVDLERHGHLVRLEAEVDPHLEMAEIQRRVYEAGGPALYFGRVKGCVFPCVSNLFGTLDRARFLFRDAINAVRHLVELKVEPGSFWKNPWRYRDVPGAIWHAWPKRVRTGPVLAHQTTISQLPHIRCWPKDGGAFVTLPAVYTENVDRPGWRHSNLGMYRVQLSGGQYEPDREVGLHYQIHRGIGVHHALAIERGFPLRVNVFVGGPPALTLAAMMPLPEGMPEIAFAGALGGRCMELTPTPGPPGKLPPLALAAETDFCIVGTVDTDRLLPEGPFGDHLGYYSLAHDFPVLRVEQVYHRADAIWPFTVVGHPPQEDTTFGALVHELTGPVIPTVVPGVHAVHAVDAAGVHPLLLAIGSERYVPYAAERRPMELLTCANAILGQGQLSLAKYLLIVAREDSQDLDCRDIVGFFRHLLERIDWQRDLHFQTCTTIDTLDYSGTALNEGSKVVMAAAGPRKRSLWTAVPPGLTWPEGFGPAHVCMPGVLALEAQAYPQERHKGRPVDVERFCQAFADRDVLGGFPLIVLVDDSEFAARKLNNFLWVTFTRSNPATDIHGIGSFVRHKHWGCTGPLLIDARIKPHHAPPLEEDPTVRRRVDTLGAPGGPLHGVI